MRRSKYNAVPTMVDGIRFASKREAARYAELLVLQAGGEISRLRVHPRYEILAGLREEDGTILRTRYYEADFEYRDREGRLVVEDVKSPATRREPLYRLKRHAFLLQYGQTCRFFENLGGGRRCGQRRRRSSRSSTPA